MADDVLITKQQTLEAAIPEALRLCRNSPRSVLVHIADDSALREENARLREALKPFGEALKDNYYHQIDALPIVAGSNQMDIRFKWTLGDLRAAAAAIREGGEEG